MNGTGGACVRVRARVCACAPRVAGWHARLTEEGWGRGATVLRGSMGRSSRGQARRAASGDSAPCDPQACTHRERERALTITLSEPTRVGPRGFARGAAACASIGQSVSTYYAFLFSPRFHEYDSRRGAAAGKSRETEKSQLANTPTAKRNAQTPSALGSSRSRFNAEPRASRSGLRVKSFFYLRTTGRSAAGAVAGARVGGEAFCTSGWKVERPVRAARARALTPRSPSPLSTNSGLVESSTLNTPHQMQIRRIRVSRRGGGRFAWRCWSVRGQSPRVRQ